MRESLGMAGEDEKDTKEDSPASGQDAGGQGPEGEESSSKPEKGGMSEGEVEEKATALAKGQERSAEVAVPKDGGEGLKPLEDGVGDQKEEEGEQEEEEEEEEEEKPTVIVKSTPFDPRFPSTNQVGSSADGSKRVFIP